MKNNNSVLKKIFKDQDISGLYDQEPEYKNEPPLDLDMIERSVRKRRKQELQMEKDILANIEYPEVQKEKIKEPNKIDKLNEIVKDIKPVKCVKSLGKLEQK